MIFLGRHHGFEIPLYEAGHKEIGKYAVSCGGHLNPAGYGMGTEEAEAILAAGGSLQTASGHIRAYWIKGNPRPTGRGFPPFIPNS